MPGGPGDVLAPVGLDVAALVGAGGREPHPRFETPPGRQLQFDWKEGMRLVDSECFSQQLNLGFHD